MKIRYQELRTNNHYTRNQIASILQVQAGTYTKWETGYNDMSLNKCNELANIYHVSIDYLLGLSDNPTHEKSKDEINLSLLPIRLRELRLNNHLTQKELGNNIHLNQRTYSHYEDGSRIPTTMKLLKIAIFYDVSIDYLIGKTPNRVTNKSCHTS